MTSNLFAKQEPPDRWRSGLARRLVPRGCDPGAWPLLAARSLRAFADGYMALLLPAYLLAIGLGTLEVGIVSTATMLGSALATLAVGTWGHRVAGHRLLRGVSNHVAVMYLGKIVEKAEAEELYRNPQHPYTKALLSAIPVPDPRAKQDRMILTGDVPSPINPPIGCHFHPRCPWATEECKQQIPPLEEKTSRHWSACIKVPKRI